MYKFTILALALSFAGTASFSQTVELVNKTVSDQNSKTVYIGMDNVFEVNAGSIQSVAAMEGVNFQQNKLIINPTMVGTMTVTLVTAAGKETINFNAKPLPEVVAAVSNSTSTISKTSIMPATVSFKTTSFGDNFYNNYSVTSFTVTLNGVSYQVEGNTFSREVMEAISAAKTGDVLKVTNVKGFNADINKSVVLRSNYIFNIE